MKNEKLLNQRGFYVPPQCVALNLELEQNILQGSGYVPDAQGEDW